MSWQLPHHVAQLKEVLLMLEKVREQEAKFLSLLHIHSPQRRVLRQLNVTHEELTSAVNMAESILRMLDIPARQVSREDVQSRVAEFESELGVYRQRRDYLLLDEAKRIIGLVMQVFSNFEQDIMSRASELFDSPEDGFEEKR